LLLRNGRLGFIYLFHHTSQILNMDSRNVVFANAKVRKGSGVLQPGFLEVLLKDALTSTIHDTACQDIDLHIVLLEGKKFIFQSLEFFIFF
jgi:hypothetical protein